MTRDKLVGPKPWPDVASVRSIGAVAGRLSDRLACRRCRRGHNARRLRNSRVAGLCRTGRLAAPGRHLRLSAWRARLCAIRLVAAPGGWSDICHLAHGCRHRGCDGRGRCAALRPDRHTGRVHRGHTLSHRMVVAPEHAGTADKRQHFGRLQGRCRVDDHHDAAAKPVWNCRRWAQLLRASGGVGRPTWPNSLSCSCHWHRSHPAAPVGRSLSAGTAGRSCHCRAVDCRSIGVWAPRAGCADDRKDPSRVAVAGRPSAPSPGCRGNCSACRRMPVARLRGQEVVRAAEDLDLPLDGLGLPALVEGHDDDCRAEAANDPRLLQE